MSVYVVAQITITNRVDYAVYEQGFMEIFAQYDGRMLAVDEAPEVVEGAANYTRLVLAEFPDKQSVHDWYDSEAYQALAANRWSASSADIVIVSGLQG